MPPKRIASHRNIDNAGIPQSEARLSRDRGRPTRYAEAPQVPSTPSAPTSEVEFRGTIAMFTQLIAARNGNQSLPTLNSSSQEPYAAIRIRVFLRMNPPAFTGSKGQSRQNFRPQGSQPQSSMGQGAQGKPPCVKCGKLYLGEYRAGRMGCYKCSQIDHFQKECPTWGNRAQFSTTAPPARGNQIGATSGMSGDFPGMNLVNFTFDGKGYGGWRRCNDMVLSWLLNSLSKEISDSVIYSKTAKALWTDLEERFGQSNGAKLYHLQKELSDLVQGSNDIATYFTKLKKLWDELDTLNADINCGCNCICGGKDKLTKSIQDERLMHFLMGLNDSYASVRGNMLIISPLPNVNVAYSILIQDEKQREKHGNYEQKEKGKFDTRKNNLTCSHCKKPGHSIDKCYRIVGFPADFKFTKTRRNQTLAHSNAVFAEEKHNDYAGNNQQFSQEQFSQLVHLLQQVKVSQSGPTSSGAEVVANSVACSGATQHMAFDSSIFFNLTPFLTPLSVNLPNSQKAPSMKRPQVLGECHGSLYLLKSPSTKFSHQQHSLLSFPSFKKNDVVPTFNSVIPVSTKDVSLSFSNSVVAKQVDVTLWHKRLGHLPYSSMKNINPPPIFSHNFNPTPSLDQHSESFSEPDVSHPDLFPNSPSFSPTISPSILEPSPSDQSSPSPVLPLDSTPSPIAPPAIESTPHHSHIPLPPQNILSTISTTKSGRPTHTPSYLKDYYCNTVFLTNLTSSCFIPTVHPQTLPFSALSMTNQHLLNSISNITEPSSYKQAALHPG
ncbi:uncharacterized protein LOC129872456 [Solanum dulcamara]|uniref:uncharacterized protein LOC129872456 n=1 Tax=Solanum dulcamara TaxID=45834 RepID=UPI002486C72F|nr:uncharacterized protein LOC129872456 [Solanum dulcamara]